MVAELLLGLLLAAAGSAAAPSGCAKGDSACHCKAIGGVWRPLEDPLVPGCDVAFSHAGRGRLVRVFFPRDYDGVTPFPVWVHLHGVFWATMGDISKRVGHPVNGTDIIPSWDNTLKLLSDKAVFVYPQSLGDAGTGDEAVDGQGEKYRQFWSIPFWSCSVGICSDKTADDVGFLEKVITDMPERLALAPGKLYLSGESAGGMMVQVLLCQKPRVADAVTAAADIMGGIGAEYSASAACADSHAVPFLKLHGETDPFITYDKRILVDGVDFFSAIEATQARARHNGCTKSDAGPEVAEAGGKMRCTDFCGKAMPAKPAAKSCGMPDVPHNTDYPYPGFVYKQAFAFFEQQAARKKPSVGSPKLPPAAAGSKVSASAAKEQSKANVTLSDAVPLQLNMSFAGLSVDEFKQRFGKSSLAAVAAVTKLPAGNITASYASLPSGSASGAGRQHRRRLAAAEGVQASYMLAAAQPGAVAERVVAAVQSGGLWKALQQQRAGGGAQLPAPTVSLDALGGEAGSLLEPTRLVPPAAAAGGKANATAVAASAADEVGVLAAGADASPDGKAGTSSEPQANSMASAPAVAAAEPSSSSSGSSSSSVNVGAIVGGVVGGVGGVALLGGLAALALSKRTKKTAATAQWQSPSRQGSSSVTASRTASEDADIIMCVDDAAGAHTKGGMV